MFPDKEGHKSHSQYHPTQEVKNMSVKQHISTALRKFPIARFYPATMSLLKGYSVGNFTSDLSAGLTVGIAFEQRHGRSATGHGFRHRFRPDT